jgi:hypothetical protein
LDTVINDKFIGAQLISRPKGFGVASQETGTCSALKSEKN